MRDIADYLYASNAVLFSQKNAKGFIDPIYIDIRYALGSVLERNAIVQRIMDILTKHFSVCDLVAGVCTAGIPFAAIAAHNLNLPMCYVRKEAKANGIGKRIEGRIEKHQKTVIIEDVVYSGSNVLNVASTLREAKLDVLGAVSIFSYDIEKSVKSLNNFMIYHQSLTSFDEVICLGVEKGIINIDEYKQLLQYRDNIPEQALYSNVTW